MRTATEQGRKTADQTALAFEGVSHAFAGRRVVADVGLALKRGEIVCLLGPSGCGKTTLLRIAAGLEPIQQGRIVLDGTIVAEPGREVAPEDRHIGFVFQDYALFPHLSVLDNVGFGLSSASPAERRARALALLERVGMARHATSFPHRLSGGEQQRVALVRALAPGPRLLLLDEPFSNLDIRLREEVRAETLAILREAGATALMVTHDAEEAMFMADRIAVMREGQLVQVDTPDAVYRRPASAFVTRFLGFVNALEARVEAGHARTALGVHCAPGLGEGLAVEVLVRPEDVAIGAAGQGVAATVVSRHRLGSDSLVVLSLDGTGGAIRARMNRVEPPAPGCRVGITVDRHAAFVFPCRDRS
jgi:iron(III) transport system ATP-binding protein